MGAEIIFYPTAIGWRLHKQIVKPGSNTSLANHSKESCHCERGVYSGSKQDRDRRSDEFWGGSFIADPFGNLLFQLVMTRKIFMSKELDLDLIEETRMHWPFLRDRRIDTYEPIYRRFLDE